MASSRNTRAGELGINLTKHVMYSPAVEKVTKEYLQKKVGAENTEEVFRQVEEQYAADLRNLPYIGGKRSVHNGEGGTYDCIFLLALYEALADKPTLQDIYDMNCTVFLPSFDKLKKCRFADANHPFVLRVIHFAFRLAAQMGKKDRDTETGFIMHVEPFSKTEGIHYRFDRCPIAEFARAHHLLHLMPALCNGDYPAMGALHAALIRRSTCANGEFCDYWIVGDKSRIAESHPRETDENGYWYNK